MSNKIAYFLFFAPHITPFVRKWNTIFLFFPLHWNVYVTNKQPKSYNPLYYQHSTTYNRRRCCHMYFTSFLYPKTQLKVYVFIASKNLSKVSCVVQFLREKKWFFSNSKNISNVVHDTQEGFERVNYYGWMLYVHINVHMVNICMEHTMVIRTFRFVNPQDIWLNWLLFIHLNGMFYHKRYVLYIECERESAVHELNLSNVQIKCVLFLLNVR